jgi:D-alanyl-D-alanine carboxypeptidase
VLGLIVERVTGHSFEEALAERILGPLDLRDTSLDTCVIPGPHADGYVLADGPRSLPGGRPFDVSDASLGAWADGALVSDVGDLATFFGALGDGKLLPPPLLKTMLAPTKDVPYGLGVMRSDLRCGPAWGSAGEIIGYVTRVLASPDGKRIVVLAANGLSQGGSTEAVDAADFFCPF